MPSTNGWRPKCLYASFHRKKKKKRRMERGGLEHGERGDLGPLFFTKRPREKKATAFLAWRREEKKKGKRGA